MIMYDLSIGKRYSEKTMYEDAPSELTERSDDPVEPLRDPHQRAVLHQLHLRALGRPEVAGRVLGDQVGQRSPVGGTNSGTSAGRRPR